jgi:hypothetical protein
MKEGTLDVDDLVVPINVTMGGGTVAATNSAGQRVVELDGTRAGPVDRGACTDLLEVRFLLFLSVLLASTSYDLGRDANFEGRFHQEQ